jgi:hypothetical protein
MSRLLIVLLGLALCGCGAFEFRYPLQKPLTKKHFEPHRAPEDVELYYSTSTAARTVRTGGSHDDPSYGPQIVDAGTEEVARSYPIPGAPRHKLAREHVKLRRLRTNLVLREVASPPLDMPYWPDALPREVLPSDEMIDDGLGQLQDMAAEAGADAVVDVFAWVLVQESRFGVGGYYQFRVVPVGVVLQGTAVRYLD